jgi:signal transduction histidine kinase
MLNDIAFGIVISLLFISIVILFCFVIIKLYIQKVKKHQQEIFQKNIDFQKAINTTILETQEQLLKSVSDDLHDDAGQQLTVINFQIENLKLDFPDNQLNSVSDSVTKLSQTIRKISHSLSSNWLDKNGLIGAIESEINRIQKNKTIHISFTNQGFESQKLSNDVQIVLYRIFQEIINNILKHAKATKIDIIISSNPKFEMRISDNGIGFDSKAAVTNSNSLGLQNLVQRAEIIDYSIQFRSEINHGCTVIVSEN